MSTSAPSVPPRHTTRRRLALGAVVLVGALALGAAACNRGDGTTATTGGTTADPGTTAAPTTTAKPKPSVSSSTTAKASSSTSSTTKPSSSTSSTTASSSTTAGGTPSNWPNVGDNELSPPPGWTMVAGAVIADPSTVYTLYQGPGGKYVVTIGRTVVDPASGKVTKRTVLAALALPGLQSGETLAANCRLTSTGADGPADVVAYINPAQASGGHPTRAWRADGASVSIGAVDPASVTCG